MSERRVRVIAKQLAAEEARRKEQTVNNNKSPFVSKINIVQVISTAILIVGIFQASPAFSHYAIGLGIAGDVLTVILRSWPLLTQPQDGR